MRSTLLDVSIESDIVSALRIAEHLRGEAASASHRDVAVLTSAIADDDAIVAIASIHALAGVATSDVDGVLVDALVDPRAWIREHAAWALSARRPQHTAIELLLDLHLSGSDLTAMIAQRTICGWRDAVGDITVEAIQRRLASTDDPVMRRRLVDTLGLLGDHGRVDVLRIAQDRHEAIDVRIAAVGSLAGSHDPLAHSTLLALAGGSSPVATAALLALFDLDRPRKTERDAAPAPRRIAQLTLTGELDGRSSCIGAGDTGGIASLLVSVSHALAGRPDVESVLSIGRSSPDGELASLLMPDVDVERFTAVSFGPIGEPPALASEWDFRATIERSLRRSLSGSAPPPDLLHLRMADVGTLAASNVARRHGIPVVFTCAPDPHGPIEQRQAAGLLSRDDFGDTDTLEHLWFRARMVERLAAQAEQLVLFPRGDAEERIVRMMGVERSFIDDHSTVAPEGIDLANIDAANIDAANIDAASSGGSWPVIDELVERLPPERHGLALVISVGRLHPVKGMVRVVHDWLSDETLTTTTNLVIVGGDLEHPNPMERQILDEIDDLLDQHPAAAGVTLLGAREPAVVAQLLSTAVRGRPADIAADGVYVNGAPKEEFGLAIIEALAAGLPVVAPRAGGPSTYVVDGVTGVLVDADEHLASAMGRARALHEVADRASQARAMVEERYTVESYTDALTVAYRRVGSVSPAR